MVRPTTLVVVVVVVLAIVRPISSSGLSKKAQQECAAAGFSGSGSCSDCEVLSATLGASAEAHDEVESDGRVVEKKSVVCIMRLRWCVGYTQVGAAVRAVVDDCRSCCIDDGPGDGGTDLRRLQNAFVKVRRGGWSAAHSGSATGWLVGWLQAVLYVDQDKLSSSRWVSSVSHSAPGL